MNSKPKIFFCYKVSNNRYSAYLNDFNLKIAYAFSPTYESNSKRDIIRKIKKDFIVTEVNIEQGSKITKSNLNAFSKLDSLFLLKSKKMKPEILFLYKVDRGIIVFETYLNNPNSKDPDIRTPIAPIIRSSSRRDSIRQMKKLFNIRWITREETIKIFESKFLPNAQEYFIIKNKL